MKHSFFSKALTLCLAVALLLAVAAPAMADYTPVGVTTNVPFNKYLVLEAGLPVPVVTYDFTIEPGDPRNADATHPAILAGPTVGTGAPQKPSIPSIQFLTTSATTNTPGTNVLTGAPLTSTQVFSRGSGPVNVDFAGVTFDKPGVYRYKITESISTGGGGAGITNDANTTRFMDVYVTDSNDGTATLAVSSVIFHNVEAGIPTNSDGTTPAGTKNTGFTNRYVASDLILSKTVTGNQGNRDEYFKFTVTINGANTTPNPLPAGTQFTVTLGGANEADGFGASDPGDTNPNVLTLTLPADVSGEVTGTYYIKNGQTITIKGLPAGTKYTITEFPIAAEGYTTSRIITVGTTAGASATSTTTGEQTMATEDQTVAFTNDRTGTVPTGILLDVAPYALLVALAGVALLMLTRKRKATEQ